MPKVRGTMWAGTVAGLTGLAAGLIFNYFVGPRWNSWPEALSTAVLIIAICFLTTFCVSAMAGRTGFWAGIGFAFSFLLLPELRYGLIGSYELLFLGVLEFIPALAGVAAARLARRYRGRVFGGG